MRLVFLTIILAGVLAPPTTTQESDSVAEVEKKLLAMVPKFKSFSATLTTTMDFSGVTTWDRGGTEGTVEYLIKGEKILSRAELVTDNKTTTGGTETQTHDEHSMYGDGEYIFDVGLTNGTPMAFKLDVDPMQIAVPSKGMFDILRKDYVTRRLPDEKIDGKPVWVVESKPKDPEIMPARRTVLYFRNDIPLMVKTASYDKFDKLFLTTTLKNIKVNPEIDPERFVFKRSEDFEYYDMTRKKDVP